MTLIRFVQRASILAGMALASLPVHGNPAQADDVLACVIASNGKTMCGTLKAVERACITTEAGSTVCGKFKSAKKEGQEEARNPAPPAGYRKEVDNFVYTLEGCQRVDTSVRCQIKMVNKGKERLVNWWAASSVLVDSTGKSHLGSQVSLGGGSTTMAQAKLAQNTDVSLGITFDNIPGQIVKAQILNLDISIGSTGERRPVQFRNVPISN